MEERQERPVRRGRRGGGGGGQLWKFVARRKPKKSRAERKRRKDGDADPGLGGEVGVTSDGSPLVADPWDLSSARPPPKSLALKTPSDFSRRRFHHGAGSRPRKHTETTTTRSQGVRATAAQNCLKRNAKPRTVGNNSPVAPRTRPRVGKKPACFFNCCSK